MREFEKRLIFIQKVRNYFYGENFIEIDTPPLVENPGMEPHIHPFKVENKYLHTSPEFSMKEVLSRTNLENIFSLGYCFRNEPHSPIHRSQFLMLEWYRSQEKIEAIENDCKDLISYLLEEEIHIQKYSMDQIFEEYLAFRITDFLDKKELVNKIKKDIKDISIPEKELDWDDYFFLIFLNKIESHIYKIPYLIINDFPSPLSALAELDQDNKKIAKRFEFYINGTEIANCFQELTNLPEQKERFKKFESIKMKNYNYSLPWPERFLTYLNTMKSSSGIALGVERLFGQLTSQESIFWD